jgi:pimeloyl-ACP methyl ester carboxylesterase
MSPQRKSLVRLSLLLSIGAVNISCGDSSPSTPEVLRLWDNDCNDPIESVYESATPPSPWTPALRGTIVRCAYDRVVTVDEMTADMVKYDRVDPGFTTDIHKIRISYWTERLEGDPILTSGVLYIPETMRASPSPLVVFAHGSVGVADKCAPSAEDPEGFERDWKSLSYSLAGDGWLVVMPDFPGLGTEGPAAWMFSPDEGHSLLDATRAVRFLGPEVVGTRNAIVGHSMGGHAALSASAAYAGYGANGSVDGMLMFSSFWLSNGAWAALVTDAGISLLNSTFYALTLMYHYGHSAAYDGVENATQLFLPEKADAIVNLLENKCWEPVTSDSGGPPSIGLTAGSDAYPRDFIDDAGNCAFNPDLNAAFCDGPYAQTWRERWVADRPAPDTNIPMVHWVGELDDFVTPGFQQCGFDRLEAQGAQQTMCVDPVGNHSDLVTRNAGYVRQYLASILLDEAAPAACAGLEVIVPAPVCSLPIPNTGNPLNP